MPISIVLILAFIISNLDDKNIHQPISIEKIANIVVFQEFYKVEPGGGGVTIEHHDFSLKPTENEGKQLVQWFNSIHDEKVFMEIETPPALAGVSFSMKNNKRKVVHYHEGIFYVSTKDHIYSFVHNDMKKYFEEILLVN
ncbi:hypothetical protein IM538_13545 [Cytobacillus suaedae]|nr:hypothetical protein IM538_13545 [Cytobacillus suaedae]